jgi:hypothetical protein
MAVPRAVLLVLALVALVLLPCLVALLVINADRPQRSSWQERWMLIRLERALAIRPAELRFLTDAMGRSQQPPIEQIASDLRRLGRHRLGLANRNPVWHEAVRRAYDDRLRLACGCLGIEQHLAELDGLDLEIERVRVEGALRAAGLVFGVSDTEPRQGHGQDRR